jgi:hypothetical protein
MQLTVRRTALAAGCAVMALSVLSVSAAPQDAGETSAQQASGDADGGNENSSRTVQILLDIQNSKSAQESPTRAARPGESQSRPPALLNEGAPGGDRASFTSLKPKKDSIEPEAPDQSRLWTRPANPPRAMTENARTQMSADSSSSLGGVDVDVRGWLPTGVMRFVRENREVVVLLSLLALGLAAFFTASASKKR